MVCGSLAAFDQGIPLVTFDILSHNVLLLFVTGVLREFVFSVFLGSVFCNYFAALIPVVIL